MPADEVYEWLEKLQDAPPDQDVVAAAVTVAPLLAERLSSDDPPAPSELHELLEGQPIEVLLMAIVLAARARSCGAAACAPTSSGCAASRSRSAATTCRQAGVPSRRRSATR